MNLLKEIYQLIEPTEIDRQGVEMTYPNVYDKKNRGIGAKNTARRETVVVKDSKTGRVYGRRTYFQKPTS